MKKIEKKTDEKPKKKVKKNSPPIKNKRKEPKQKMKRLSMHISEKLHRACKCTAALQGMTIQNFVIELIKKDMFKGC